MREAMREAMREDRKATFVPSDELFVILITILR